jgi:hypothetical protein
MRRVLFQVVSSAASDSLARTRAELSARGFSTDVAHVPAIDLAPFALAHLVGFESATFTLRGALNALSQQKSFVITLSVSTSASAPPLKELEPTLERAVLKFIGAGAAVVFCAAESERVMLARALEMAVDNIRLASSDAYASAYHALAHRANTALMDDERMLRALEDAALASSVRTYRADEYYYQTLTPQLERDAQRAQALQAALLEPRR